MQNEGLITDIRHAEKDGKIVNNGSWVGQAAARENSVVLVKYVLYG